MSAWARRRLLLAAFGVLLACDPDLPGDAVGTFKVKVSLQDNGCGPGAVYTNDGRSYSVELREDAEKGRGYWHVPKQHPLTGSIEGETFTFSYDSVVASTPADAGVPGCTLTQTEVLTGTFVRADAGAAAVEDASADARDAGDDGDAGSAHDLEATHTLTISAAAGSSCASALTPRGRFTSLPCTVVYALTGSARGPL